MSQMFHEQAREVGTAEVVPLGAAVPVCIGREVGAVAPTCMRSSRRGGASMSDGSSARVGAASMCGRVSGRARAACLVL
jgi:hypothetical protein